MTGYLIPKPPQVSPKATVVAHAAAVTLTVDDMGKIHTNTGEGDNSPWTLPAAAAAAGCAFRVQLTVAQTVTLEPGAASEKIYLGGDGVANKHAVIAGVIGNYADLYSDGEAWLVLHYSGVLTKEA